jgi:PKD repeat protein
MRGIARRVPSVTIAALVAVGIVGLFVSTAAGGSAPVSPVPSDGYGWPSWWAGSDCDSAHWNAAAAKAGWTGGGAYELGASYLGVPVCGPRPTADGAPPVWWTNWAGGEQEWTDTELAFRFMALVYGAGAYPATGATLVSNYQSSDGGQLTAVQNSTVGAAPRPGNIISFTSSSDLNGHVAVVTSSSVDNTGNGSITVMSQDDTADGWRTLTDVNWQVQGYGNETPTAWLQYSGGFGYGYFTGNPIAGFTSSPASPDPGTQVSFDGSGSFDLIGNIWDYEWQFGDGTYSGGSPTFGAQYPIHTYASPGTYSVTMTVTDDLLNSATFTRQVTVGGSQHIWYIDRATGALHDGSWNGSAWQFQKVDGPGASGTGHTKDPLSGPIATTTADGVPSAWYFDKKTGALRAAIWSGTHWRFRVVDGPGSTSKGHTKDKLTGTIAATTVRGNTTTCYFQPPPTSCTTSEAPAVWYLDAHTGALREAQWTGSAWKTSIVDGPGAKTAKHTRHRLGALAAVTIADRTPALWYIDLKSEGLREAVWTGTSWRLRTLDGPGSAVAGHTQDALAGPVTVTAPYNLPNVAYFDAKTGALRDSYWNGAAWQFSSVDGPGTSSAGHTSHKLGGAVVSAVPPVAPQVWYLDAHTGSLRHLWWENSLWRAELVDGLHAKSSGTTADKLSGPLAVTTTNGDASVVYLDALTHEIRQATWTGADWQVTVVEHGAASSLAAAPS